jgi:hypothetical protein
VAVAPATEPRGRLMLAGEHARTRVFCPFQSKAFQPLCPAGPTFVSQISTFMSQTTLMGDIKVGTAGPVAIGLTTW